jgi:hypothetical protein
MHEYSFEKLVVWQKARDFVSFIYEITKNFPKEEKYGLALLERGGGSGAY